MILVNKGKADVVITACKAAQEANLTIRALLYTLRSQGFQTLPITGEGELGNTVVAYECEDVIILPQTKVVTTITLEEFKESSIAYQQQY